jgi:hypothetical protein
MMQVNIRSYRWFNIITDDFLCVEHKWSNEEVDREIVPLWREMEGKTKKKTSSEFPVRYDIDISLDRKDETIDISLCLFHFSSSTEKWMNRWLWILFISVKKEFFLTYDWINDFSFKRNTFSLFGDMIHPSNNCLLEIFISRIVMWNANSWIFKYCIITYYKIFFSATHAQSTNPEKSPIELCVYLKIQYPSKIMQTCKYRNRIIISRHDLFLILLMPWLSDFMYTYFLYW